MQIFFKLIISAIHIYIYVCIYAYINNVGVRNKIHVMLRF